LSWFRLFVSSSLGKKYIMAITGLLLCGFLVTHLAGNLLMYLGPEAYNNYTHALHNQEWLVKIAEFGLLVIFVLHLWLAFAVAKQNRAARDVSYAVNRTKEGAEIAPARVDAWMMWSGVIVLIFLLYHLWDFTFEWGPDSYYKMGDGNVVEPYDKASAILSNTWTLGVYVVGTIALCAHLAHGFSSAFRSLGISHPRYNRCIRILGYFFAVIFGLGFATFPIWFYFK
jgi:succinate dehydrogenase / fumarate reductase, cytochrome b subunit